MYILPLTLFAFISGSSLTCSALSHTNQNLQSNREWTRIHANENKILEQQNRTCVLFSDWMQIVMVKIPKS